MSNSGLFKILLLSLVGSSAVPVYSLAHPSPKIIWTPCGNTTIPRECGTFEVPLDYKNSGAGKALLAVARINATKTPRLGTLFTNPGGPGQFFCIGFGLSTHAIIISGGSGVEWILSDDIFGMNQGSGGQYDIVSKCESPLRRR